MKRWLPYWGPLCAIIGVLITGTLAWSDVQHRVDVVEERVIDTDDAIRALSTHLQEEREARRRMERTLCLVCESVRGESKCPTTCSKEY